MSRRSWHELLHAGSWCQLFRVAYVCVPPTSLYDRYTAWYLLVCEQSTLHLTADGLLPAEPGHLLHLEEDSAAWSLYSHCLMHR